MGIFAIARMVPTWAYKLIGVLLIALGLILYGGHRVQVKWDAEKEAAKAHVEVVKGKQELVNKIVDNLQLKKEIEIKTVYKDRVVYRDREVIREVLVKEDAECDVSNRFVSVWNSANRGEVPDPTRKPDEGTSNVKISDIEAQHEIEAEINALNVQQILGWQEWARQQGLVE